jgi:uncharacterized RDD family membrane protein YckC
MYEGIPKREFEPDSSARCAQHPEVVARGTCTRCGAFVCNQCSEFTANGLRCASCQLNRQQNFILADRGSRFAANFIDSFVFSVPLLVVFFVIILVAGVASISDAGDSNQNSKWDALIGFGVCSGFLFTLAVGTAVQVFSFQKYGRSLGKKWLNMRVVRSDGSPVDLMRLIFLRNVIPSAVAQLCGIIGLVDALMIFGQEQRCLHDLIADTIVIVDNGDSRGDYP